MTGTDTQKAIANSMGAFVHLVTGSAGRLDEFIGKVSLLIGSGEPTAMQLMQCQDFVRRSGRPFIWIHQSKECAGFPRIGLVTLEGERTIIVENCMLWMTASDDRAWLIPDCLKSGAFRFDDDLQLRYVKKSPATSIAKARKSMLRAYDRLVGLETAQRERGDVFTLPSMHGAA